MEVEWVGGGGVKRTNAASIWPIPTQIWYIYYIAHKIITIIKLKIHTSETQLRNAAVGKH